MIRALTIDFWNTIVDSSHGEARRQYRDAALRAALASCGRTVTPEELARAYAVNTTRFEEVWRTEQRTLSTSDSLYLIWEALGASPPPAVHDDTVRAFQESVLVGVPDLLPGAAAVLRALATRYALAVISDTAFSPGTMLRQVLAHHGLAELFRVMIFSDEVGASKPDPRTFQAALTALGVHAEEAVHIGDIDRTDIRGARGVGMRTIRFTGDRGRSYAEKPEDREVADAEASSWNDVPGILSRFEVVESATTKDPS